LKAISVWRQGARGRKSEKNPKQLATADEGDYVERFGDVGRFFSYQGGDGNDIAPSAQTVPEPGTSARLFMMLVGLSAGRYTRA